MIPPARLQLVSIHRAAPALAAVLTVIAFAAEADARSQAEKVEFFEQHIRPVLIGNCLECHGRQRAENYFRVDSRQNLIRGGRSGRAVNPENPDDSRLIQAIRYEHERLEMPPTGKLDERVIEKFEQWVADGAVWPNHDNLPQDEISLEEGRTHWAYQPLEDPDVPEIEHAATPIDAFILKKLEENELTPNEPADRRTLIRRATFDLTGLPPTPEQVEAFVSDDSENAYEQLIDDLLASPEYGRRWGRHWMDVARYADTSGDGVDRPVPEAQLYRDYIIDAFNNDMPFDEFVVEQVAGDILAEKTGERYDERVIATSYIALSRRYGNGTFSDFHLVVENTLDTIGKGLLGHTLSCARCHDHKFDPIPEDDYYALYGFFSSTQYPHPGSEHGRQRSHLVPYEGEQIRKIAEWEASLHEHLEKLTQLKDDLHERIRSEGDGDDAHPADHPLMQTLVKVDTQAAALRAELGSAAALGDQEAIELDELLGIVVDNTEAQTTGDWETSTRSRYVHEHYHHDGDAGKGEKTITYTPDLPRAGRYEVRLAYAHGNNRPDNLPVTIDHAEGSETVEVDQTAEPPIDGAFVSLGTFGFEAGEAGSVTLSNEGTEGYVIADAVVFLPVDTFADDASPGEAHDEAAELIAAAEADLESRPREPLKAYGVADRADPSDIGDARIHIAGNRRNRGPAVPRGFLSVITPERPEIPEGQSGRLQLARWLVSEENPLTPRVMANRIWHWHFGRGIVPTPDDFGKQGQPPTHPELLDYLASRFVDGGWSFKNMHREIMLSDAYQRASTTDSANVAVDPENELLWRYDRRRLEAEAIRDAMLAVSGQLRHDAPPEHPFGSIESHERFSQHRPFLADFDDYDHNHRAVYLMTQRLQKHPFLGLFDGPNRNEPTGRRSISTVALQSLFMMNSAFIRENAQALAGRLLALDAASDRDRLAHAFELAFTRPAEDVELDEAIQFLEAAEDDLDDLEPDERRKQALASFARVLLSSSEFIYLD